MEERRGVKGIGVAVVQHAPDAARSVDGGSEMAGGDEMTCYAFRMQRDMQRIGEAAGIAAAIAVEEGKTNAKVPYPKLREALLASGALTPLKDEKPLFGRATTTFEGDPVLTGPATDENVGKWLKALSDKEPGIALWRLYRLEPDTIKGKVLSILRKGTATAKGHAALLLASWGCKEAAPYLIACLADKSCRDDRMAAAWALGQCGDRRAYPALRPNPRPRVSTRSSQGRRPCRGCASCRRGPSSRRASSAPS